MMDLQLQLESFSERAEVKLAHLAGQVDAPLSA